MAVMSRMSTRSSVSVPASAGVRSAGGSYCTVMGRWRGSRPRRRQMASMVASTAKGIASGQFEARKPAARSSRVGSRTNPLSQPTTAVTPSRNSSGRGIRMAMPEADSVSSASRRVAPCTPLNAVARTPVAPSGSVMAAVTMPSGTSHSSPVTFQ